MGKCFENFGWRGVRALKSPERCDAGGQQTVGVGEEGSAGPQEAWGWTRRLTVP